MATFYELYVFDINGTLAYRYTTQIIVSILTMRESLIQHFTGEHHATTRAGRLTITIADVDRNVYVELADLQYIFGD